MNLTAGDGWVILAKTNYTNTLGIQMNLVIIQVDTLGKLPVPQDNWAVGSRCDIVDSGDVRFLNTQRAWVGPTGTVSDLQTEVEALEQELAAARDPYNSLDLRLDADLATTVKKVDIYNDLDSDSSTKVLSAAMGKLLNEIASGKTSTFVIDTEEDLVSITGQKVGDNCFIRQLDVPDRWWDGTTWHILETTKIDIPGPATEEEDGLMASEDKKKLDNIGRSCTIGGTISGYYKVASGPLYNGESINAAFTVTSLNTDYISGMLQLQIIFDGSRYAVYKFGWQYRSYLMNTTCYVKILDDTWEMYLYREPTQVGDVLFILTSTSVADITLYNSDMITTDFTPDVGTTDISLVGRAKQLENPVNINGQPFDGTQDITVPYTNYATESVRGTVRIISSVVDGNYRLDLYTEDSTLHNVQSLTEPLLNSPLPQVEATDIPVEDSVQYVTDEDTEVIEDVDA